MKRLDARETARLMGKAPVQTDLARSVADTARKLERAQARVRRIRKDLKKAESNVAGLKRDLRRYVDALDMPPMPDTPRPFEDDARIGMLIPAPRGESDNG